MEIKPISYHSDIEAIVTFTDEHGVRVGIPSYDFEIEYFVNTDKKVWGGRVNGILTDNAETFGDALHLFFDKPELGKGRLRTRKRLHIPNPYFPDRVRTVVSESNTDVVII